MRGLLLAGTVLLMAQTQPPATLPAPPPPSSPPPPRDNGHARLFISPMGEPFRSDGGTEPQDLWFQGADANHDGALSRAEFAADAARFFVSLDREHDGEIDPQDLEYYEGVLVPEIRVASAGPEPEQSSDGDSSGPKKPAYPDRQGAARFGYFGYPEPIIVADTNFNRGVDATEFRTAADDRFDILDTNHDGMIRHDELPRISPPRGDSGVGGRDHGRGGGHGHRGGGGGGGRPPALGGSGL